MSLIFDGTTAVNLGSRSQFDITGTITMMTWVKTTAVTGGKFFAKWNDTGPSLSYLLQQSLTTFLFGVNAGPGIQTATSTTAINTGIWIHTCGVYDNTNVIAYHNGVAEASSARTGAINVTGTELKIGAGGDGGTNQDLYTGETADLRIYNRALSAAEIMTIYRTRGHDGIVNSLALRILGSEWGPGVVLTDSNPVRDISPNGFTTGTRVITSGTGISFGGDQISKAKIIDNTTFPVVAPKLNRVLCLQADQGLLPDASGKVINWYDQSPSNFHCYQYDSTFRPGIAAVSLNGLPAVTFNGAQYLILPRPIQDDWTVYALLSATAGGTGTTFPAAAAILGAEVSDVSNDWGLGMTGGQFVAGTGNPDVSIVTGSGFYDGLPHLVTFRRDKAAGFISLYIDGRIVAQSTGASTSTLNTPTTAQIGLMTNSSTLYLTGNIGEILAYSTPHNQQTLNIMHRYFSLKYNLSTYRT